MSLHLVVIPLLICAQAGAADGKLELVRSTLLKMRGEIARPVVARGATPELTVAKHALRDWIESRLDELKSNDDEAELSRTLNSLLRAEHLFCDFEGPGSTDCNDQSFLGHVEPIKIHTTGRFLIVQTAVGILCGFDESAYIYTKSNDFWRRVWENEQTDYTEAGYKPQTISSLQTIDSDEPNEVLILTLGSQSWCSSNWRNVYYRVFRIGSERANEKILQGEEIAWLDAPIEGSLNSKGVLIEYRVGSIDSGIHNRPKIRHYKFEDGFATRIHPVALSPGDFVDEWLKSAWKESIRWTELTNQASLGQFHAAFQKSSGFGEFIYPTKYCQNAADLWQVGLQIFEGSSDQRLASKATFFMVRWRPPHRFSLVGVSDRPSTACTRKDSEADDRTRTLFPPRGLVQDE